MSEVHPYMRDTSREAATVYYEVLRSMRPEERLRRALDLSDQARAVLEAGIRHRHPEYDDRSVHLAAVRLSLGKRLFREAFSDREVEP